MLSYVPNHSKHSKTRKMIKSRWISSIWRLNDQKCWVTSQTIPNTAKLQKCSNHNELYRFDVKTIKNVELRSNHSKHSKTTKVIKLRWIASIWRLNDQKCWVTYQTIPNTGKLQKCIGLTSKRSKMLSYVPNHSKHSKTTKVIKSRWIATIWCQNDQKFSVTFKPIQTQQNKTIKNVELRPKPFKTQQNKRYDVKTIKNFQLRSTIPNTAKQKWSNYDELHRFDVKTIKNVELRPKPFEHSKTTKVIKLRWIATIMTSKR